MLSNGLKADAGASHSMRARSRRRAIRTRKESLRLRCRRGHACGAGEIGPIIGGKAYDGHPRWDFLKA
jgi:hypothetical protein